MPSWFGCLVGIRFSGWERVSLHHRIPLYNIVVALSLIPVGSLQNFFMSINANINAQFTNFSTHPGALQPLKNEGWTKLTIEMWSQIFERLYLASECFNKRQSELS